MLKKSKRPAMTRRPRPFRLVMSLVYLMVSAPAVGNVKPYDLDDPSEPWRRSQSGMTHEIMPPYTPLVRQGHAVSCWGRSYTLEGLLQATIRSQQRARPSWTPEAVSLVDPTIQVTDAGTTTLIYMTNPEGNIVDLQHWTYTR